MRRELHNLSILIFLLFCEGTVFASACSNSIPNSPLSRPSPMGSISGTLRNSRTGSPVVGAEIQTNPLTESVTSDSFGTFTITGIALEDAPLTYRVTVRAPGFHPLTLNVSLSSAAPSFSTTIDLQPVTLPVPGPPPGARGTPIDIRVSLTNISPQHGDTLTFRVELTNSALVPATNVIITDTLDGFSYAEDPSGGFNAITENDVEIVRSLFPSAMLVLNSNGLSFTINVGVVPPTNGFVTVYTVRVRYPDQNGIYINTTWIAGDVETEHVSQRDETGIIDTQ